MLLQHKTAELFHFCFFLHLNAALRRLQDARSIGVPFPSVSTPWMLSKSNQKKSQVYKLIANGIINWRDFGRELGISESMLHNLDRTSERNIPTIIYRILEFVEEGRADNIIVDQLIEVLKECGQNTLVNKIRKIMYQ